MTKRIAAMAAVVMMAVFALACGSDSSTPTPVPTPTPVTRADVHMIVDPSVIRPNYEGNGWYRFKVNLGFNETNGIAATVNTVRTTITSAATGNVLLDEVSAIPASIARVPASNGMVIQFTSPQYHMAGGTSAGSIAFVASLTDDRGNAITLNGQASMLVHGEPKELP